MSIEDEIEREKKKRVLDFIKWLEARYSMPSIDMERVYDDYVRKVLGINKGE